MSKEIAQVFKTAAKQMGEGIAKAGRAVTSCFRDAGTGLRHTASSHHENDSQHSQVFDRTHNDAEPNVRPRGNAEAPPTQATPGPSTSKGWSPHNNTAEPRTADELYQKSAHNEPKISQDMEEIMGKHGATPEGWQYRRKEQDSLQRKVDADAAKLGKGLPADKQAQAQELAVGKINDTVRYTAGFPKDKYTEGAQKTIDDLVAKGYQPIDGKFKNTWSEHNTGPGSDRYQGINSNWVDPSTGQRFEVQLHTNEPGEGSFWAKDEGTHHLYEQARVLPDGPEKDALNAQQGAIFQNVPRPPGAHTVAPPTGSGARR